jgi:hypothetical protein
MAKPEQTGLSAPIDQTRFVNTEAVLYRHSPLGFFGTTSAIFLITFGAFLLIAVLTDRPAPFEVYDAESYLALSETARQALDQRLSVQLGDTRYVLHQVAWIGFVLSLILTAAIALSENGRRVWLRFEPLLIASLPSSGHADARAITRGSPVSWKKSYQIFFFAGFAGGIIFNIFMMFVNDANLWQYVRSIGLWFLIFSPFLYGMGLRAGTDVARESGEIKRLIHQHLKVDLFHLDRLQVYGHIGLRGALSWLIMASIVLLFIADRSQVWNAVITVLMSVAGGVFVLVSAIQPVHRKIRDAKQVELERIHEEMALCRDRALAGDASASGALAGLTDYEQWIEKRSEWPVSPSVTQRFALYILIPVIPIIGSYVFERVADQIL